MACKECTGTHNIEATIILRMSDLHTLRQKKEKITVTTKGKRNHLIRKSIKKSMQSGECKRKKNDKVTVRRVLDLTDLLAYF